MAEQAEIAEAAAAAAGEPSNELASYSLPDPGLLASGIWDRKNIRRIIFVQNIRSPPTTPATQAPAPGQGKQERAEE